MHRPTTCRPVCRVPIKLYLQKQVGGWIEPHFVDLWPKPQLEAPKTSCPQLQSVAVSCYHHRPRNLLCSLGTSLFDSARAFECCQEPTSTGDTPGHKSMSSPAPFMCSTRLQHADTHNKHAPILTSTKECLWALWEEYF